MNEDWICLHCGKWNSFITARIPNHCAYCGNGKLKPLPSYIPEVQICRWRVETGAKIKCV